VRLRSTRRGSLLRPAFDRRGLGLVGRCVGTARTLGEEQEAADHFSVFIPEAVSAALELDRAAAGPRHLRRLERGKQAVQQDAGRCRPLGQRRINAGLDTLRWVFIAVALAGIAVTIHARIDDWKRGRR
jgi:hypothetical protein